MTINQAKDALDSVIKKARVHLYKPTQIAEILYHHRTEHNFDLNNLESYRNTSKRWRNEVSTILVGRASTSSARYQDNVFEENAMPPRLLAELGEENERTQGMVEAYIYSAFIEKHRELRLAIDSVRNATAADFRVADLLGMFNNRPGLRRSIDKVYEIVVYALFDTLVEAMEATITLSINESNRFLVQEFDDFTRLVLGIDSETLTYTTSASLYRVGVTNAADRGLDMWANFGPAIQVKHLNLDLDLAGNIVGTVEADKIVIVCRDCDATTIRSVMNQIGWGQRIQGIITETQLEEWYERALRGTHSDLLAHILLRCMVEELEDEFPSEGHEEGIAFFESRGYHNLQLSGIWAPNEDLLLDN